MKLNNVFNVCANALKLQSFFRIVPEKKMIRSVSVDSRYVTIAKNFWQICYPSCRNLFVPHISVSKPDCKYYHKNSYIFAVALQKMIIRSQLELGLPVVLFGYSNASIWRGEVGLIVFHANEAKHLHNV